MNADFVFLLGTWAVVALLQCFLPCHDPNESKDAEAVRLFSFLLWIVMFCIGWFRNIFMFKEDAGLEPNFGIYMLLGVGGVCGFVAALSNVMSDWASLPYNQSTLTRCARSTH